MVSVATNPEWTERVASQYADAIRRHDPANQRSFQPNVAAWRRWNPSNGTVAWMLERYGSGIHRCDLARLAQDLSTTELRREAFVSVLVWGAGSTNRYYGHHHRALQHPELDDILLHSLESIRSDDLGHAWTIISPLPGLRYPFFTKWLWFAGVSSRLDAPPLIFDSRVIGGLLTREWPWKPRRSNMKRRWVDYCRDSAAIAAELGVPPEWFEYWLFEGAPER